MGIGRGEEEVGGKEERRNRNREDLAECLSGAGMQHSFLEVHLS